MLYNNEKKEKQLWALPTFKTFKTCDEKLASIESMKSNFEQTNLSRIHNCRTI